MSEKPPQKYCPKCGNAMLWEIHRKGAATEHRRWKCGRCRHLSAQHKMQFEQFQQMLDAQSGGCAICGSVEELVIDHDHSCCPAGKSCPECRRGLLCHTCNRMLGLGKDKPSLLLLAAAYLLAAETREK